MAEWGAKTIGMAIQRKTFDNSFYYGRDGSIHMNIKLNVNIVITKKGLFPAEKSREITISC